MWPTESQRTRIKQMSRWWLVPVVIVVSLLIFPTTRGAGVVGLLVLVACFGIASRGSVSRIERRDDEEPPVVH